MPKNRRVELKREYEKQAIDADASETVASVKVHVASFAREYFSLNLFNMENRRNFLRILKNQAECSLCFIKTSCPGDAGSRTLATLVTGYGRGSPAP